MNVQRLQDRNRELSILNAIAAELNRETELHKALQSTLAQTVQLLDLQTGWIWLFGVGDQTATIAAAYNLPPALLERPELLEGSCYCIDMYNTGDMRTAANISEITCSRLKNLTDGAAGLRYHASVPLMSHGAIIGILNVVSPELQQLSDEKLQLLYTIGDMLGIAIERTQLFENSKQLGRAEERNRLARDIHDTLAQGLSAISLKLETIEALLEAGAEREKIGGVVARTLQLTKSNLEELRNTMLDLRATPLQKHTLPDALRELLTDISNRHSFDGFFDVTGAVRALPIRMEMGAFRIAQEALQNAAKHAEAHNVFVNLTYLPDGVRIVIEDDGKGFATERQTAGFGLAGITERVRLLEGELEIQSSEGIGSVIDARLPLVTPFRDTVE